MINLDHLEQKEIIYRIYEITEKNDDDWCNQSKKPVAQEVLICDNRQHFKNIIKDLYGKDIKFKASSSYPVGTLYCIIIGEQCWGGSENYTTLIDCTCDCCKRHFKALPKSIHRINKYTLSHKFGNDPRLEKMVFCSGYCANKKADDEEADFLAKQQLPLDFNAYISQEDFVRPNITGYIYKITKRTTGEFYIGKSIYAPIFRWGQHLKSSRFPISDIEDYILKRLRQFAAILKI